MKIYQVPINNDGQNPEIIATSIEQFLAKLNDDIIDTENYYFLTNYGESVLSVINP